MNQSRYLVDVREEVVDAARDDASVRVPLGTTGHRERLPAARLFAVTAHGTRHTGTWADGHGLLLMVYSLNCFLSTYFLMLLCNKHHKHYATVPNFLNRSSKFGPFFKYICSVFVWKEFIFVY